MTSYLFVISIVHFVSGDLATGFRTVNDVVPVHFKTHDECVAAIPAAVKIFWARHRVTPVENQTIAGCLAIPDGVAEKDI